MVGYGISVSLIVLGPVDTMIPERVSRQGYLCLISLVNSLHYSWVARYPMLTVMYLHHYFPDMCSSLVGWVGPKIVAKIRANYGATENNS